MRAVAPHSAIATLEHDIAFVEKQISEAQDDVNECIRVCQIPLMRSTNEAKLRALDAIISQRVDLERQLGVLVATHPELRTTNTVASGQVTSLDRDRHTQLTEQIAALEVCEHRWQPGYEQLGVFELQLKRLQDRVLRLERTHSDFSQRLYDLTMREQLKALQNQPVEGTR